MTETKELIPANEAPANVSYFNNITNFESAQRMAKILGASDLVPKEYRGNLPNCVIALEVAMRTNSSPLAVMQNLYIVHGRPSWSAQFTIAALNSCGRFSPLRFEMTGEGEKRTCTAWCYEKATNDKLEGPAVSMAMAKAEGWSTKNGSKWLTMPELMLRYRAASFFCRLYAPEILMGMKSEDEVIDMHQGDGGAYEPKKTAAEDINAALGIKTGAVIEQPKEKPAPVEQPKQANHSVDANKKGDACTACEGQGKNSNGGDCKPCGGTGQKKTPGAKTVECPDGKGNITLAYCEEETCINLDDCDQYQNAKSVKRC